MKFLTEDFMKTFKKITIVFLALLLATFLFSCASTGEYMPKVEGEIVIGTVQTTFLVQSSFFFITKVKETVNKQAYVGLMEVAGQKYSGNIDLRDVVWVTGNTVNNIKTEIFATAKVIKND